MSTGVRGWGCCNNNIVHVCVYTRRVAMDTSKKRELDPRNI